MADDWLAADTRPDAANAGQSARYGDGLVLALFVGCPAATGAAVLAWMLQAGGTEAPGNVLLEVAGLLLSAAVTLPFALFLLSPVVVPAVALLFVTLRVIVRHRRPVVWLRIAAGLAAVPAAALPMAALTRLAWPLPPEAFSIAGLVAALCGGAVAGLCIRPRWLGGASSQPPGERRQAAQPDVQTCLPPQGEATGP